jgi:predicted Fe-Mo cluster-binding NifX family protein
MKIAVISDDGKTISQHFGMASLYVVYTVENGKVVNKETRPKMGHQHFAAGEAHSHKEGEKHGYDADAQSKHGMMAQPLSDCQVLLAGGMGWGAFDSMKSFNVEPIITEVSDIEQAVKLYIEGKLVNRMEKLH